MARPLRIEYPGAMYHITSRGNERKDIFRSVQDRGKFLSYLESASRRYKAIVHVFCLMNNHYHLFLETPLGNLSQIMRHINGSYTTYFNVKRKRYGHLFQGRYKAILVDADEYAGELSRYIHLNPVRAALVKSPEEYEWSSYQYYIGQKRAPDWLKIGFILEYFDGKTSAAQKKYREFVDELIQRDYDSPLKNTIASAVLGTDEFVEEIKERYVSGRGKDRNLPSLAELLKKSIPHIEEGVRPVLGHNSALSRQAMLYLCHHHSGRTLKEIGGYFGIGESAVSQASARFIAHMNEDKKLRRKIDIIRKNLKL